MIDPVCLDFPSCSCISFAFSQEGRRGRWWAATQEEDIVSQANSQGALNKPEVDGVSLVHQSFLQDERFRSVDLPKLVEEEKTRASDDDIDLSIDWTVDEQKVQLVAWNRFRFLHHSGKIRIRSSNIGELLFSL